MPYLTPPTERVHRPFLAAMAEFRAQGRGGHDDDSTIALEMRRYAPVWDTPEGFARFVAELRARALKETPRPDYVVPSTTLWRVDGDEYLGRIAIRHRLTPFLLEYGGAARRFYERHGLVAVEQTDGTANEEREPDVRYVWRPT